MDILGNITSDLSDITHDAFWSGDLSQDYSFTPFVCSFFCEIEYMIINQAFYEALKLNWEIISRFDERYHSV